MKDKGKNKKRRNNERSSRSNKRLKSYKEESTTDEEEYNTEEEAEEELINFLEKLANESNGAITFSIEDEDEEESSGRGNNKYDNYLKKLTKSKRDKLLKLEDKLLKFNSHDIPLRYKILESNLNDKTKAQILQKAIHFENLNPIQGEYFKLKKYMDGIMSIPFGKLSRLPIKKGDKILKIQNFMENIKIKLDNCIYGQNLAKQNLLQIIGKWVTNPEGTGNVIGLCGPPGIGKTSIIKNGLSKALNMPFSFITLGGSTHASTLEGFDFTYEGSKWGRIVEILIENKCMNPVIFFDELDKISETKAGEEIVSILIHLTDSSQNNSFNDRYFSGIDFDLSKAFLIFSFNDVNKIHPILRDRINIINLEGFNAEEKIKIARDFSLKKICKNIGFKEDKIIIPDETLRVIISTYCPEKGIRKLEKCLETLIMKINLFDMTKDIKNLTIKGDLELSEPYHIDAAVAVRLLDPQYRKNDMSMAVKMMYS
jgi:ATP-dependent Lon protease